MYSSELEGKPVIGYVKRANKKLKQPKITYNRQLNHLIDNARTVYVTGDWHLWGMGKDGIIRKGKRFYSTIQELRKLRSDDFLIFLGDLVNDEFEDKDALRRILSEINCRTVMILGNNDVMDREFYEQYFDFVVEAFQWKDITFSHFPLPDFTEGFNIHGHIHESTTYWDYCPRNYNAFREDGSFFTLDEILNFFNKGYVNHYGKFIKRES